jgi:uncharacterized protein YbjQ (UPF0145 family)
MENSMIATAFELPGYEVTKNLGVVRGLTVRSRSIIGVRYDATEIMAGLTEVLFYGTAVIVTPAAAASQDLAAPR